jgi:pilus assembly protein CpaE
VDLGRPFPSIAKFLDQNPGYSLSDFIHNRVGKDDDFIKKVMYSYTPKIDILHGANDLDDQNELNTELVGQLLGQLRHLYKWVIIDLSSWIDNIFIKVLNEADMILLTTSLGIIDLHNMQMFWRLVKEWGLPYSKIKIVVNRLNRGNSVQLSILKDITHTSPFETFPSCYLPLNEALNAGKPLGIFAPRTDLWKRIQHLADQVQQQVKFVPGETGAHANKRGSKRRFWVF